MILTSSAPPVPRILIADDQADLLESLRLLLKGHGFLLETAASPDAVIAALRHHVFDLVLVDLNYTGDTTSGAEGLDLLGRIRSIDPLLPVVAMTGWGTVEVAVEAMRRGVKDFVQKPWDNRLLVELISSEIHRGRHERERARLERRELDEARRIQQRLLPSSLPAIDGWELAASWQPAAGVGGDCYDVLPFGHARLGLCIADVVGKGIPAALLMSNVQAAVKAFASEATPPYELCQQLNRVLCGNIAEDRFVSFFYCRLDAQTQTLVYSNAGHYAPFLVRKDGSHSRLEEGGTVLGVFADSVYSEGQVDVSSGDRIVLYTDGLTEARNDHDEEYGEDRLASLVALNRGCSAPALQARIMAAVSAFTGGSFQDDATLIVMAAD
jgi:sigma-B regulation protein RsbU (phosphoserine phosphatase)